MLNKIINLFKLRKERLFNREIDSLVKLCIEECVIYERGLKNSFEDVLNFIEGRVESEMCQDFCKKLKNEIIDMQMAKEVKKQIRENIKNDLQNILIEISN
jgi:hypothetical protein